MNVGDDLNTVAAVYHAKSPDKSKGHKEFMLLVRTYDPVLGESGMYISGMNRRTIKKYSKVQGLLCLSCKTALWSLNRHH